MNLKTIFDNHTDKFCGKWTHYFDAYERHLGRFVGQEFTLFEIGIANGGSLQIWKKYFGPKVRIVGIDIDPRTIYQEEQIQTFCGSQSDFNFLIDVVSKTGTPDVIIDDGSHDQLDVLNSYSILYPKLNNNGVYIVEDAHTAYSFNHSGGITSPINFITVASKFAHDVNLQWIGTPYTPSVSDLKSISFYDSMVVLEKQQQEKREPCYVGNVKIPGV